jgi:hypothetical protein
MQCPIQRRENAELLLAYCNRTLAPDQSDVLDAHVEKCDSCRRLVESQQLVWSALDAWEAMEVTADFDRRLRQRIEADQRRSWWRRVLQPVQPISWRPALPLAAACVGVIAVFLMRGPEAAPVAVQPARAEAVDIEQVERTLEDLEMLQVLTVNPQGEASSS